jgi:hypothetical protein
MPASSAMNERQRPDPGEERKTPDPEKSPSAPSPESVPSEEDVAEEEPGVPEEAED